MTKTSLHDCGLESILEMDFPRCSKDRHALLDLFGEDRAWTMDDLRTTLAHTATATIYRNVELFVKTENIEPISLNGATYYELTGRDHHDHKVCKKCAGAYCVDCPIPTVKDHLLQLSFICSACKK